MESNENNQNINDINGLEPSSTINQQILDLINFKLQNKVGSGSFGKVYKIVEKMTGQVLAAKISFKSYDDINESETINIIREVNIISKLNHPSILKFYGYSPINFKKKSKPVIITEYASNGSLEELIQSARDPKSNIAINDTIKLIIIYGIASAMSYLHSNNILHRDLKPANILLNDYLFPKVADFGLSKVNHQNQSSLTYSGNGCKGTPIYMSPEIWGNYEYSEASDVYAFAIILYELITYKKPFENCNFWDIPLKIQDGYRPELKEEIPISYRNLIQKCWSQEAFKRPTFDEILYQLKNDHSFITEKVNEKDFNNYIKYIDEYKITFDSFRSDFSIEQLFTSKESTINRVNLNIQKDVNNSIQINDQSTSMTVIPFKFNVQIKYCKKYISELGDTPEEQFNYVKIMVEGQYYFFQNAEIGIMKLLKLIQKGHKESIIYYCNLMIKGKIIPKNREEVMRLLNILKDKNDEETYSLIYGKLLYNEKEYSKAREQFEKSIEYENDEALYQYGKMILKGLGIEINENEGLKYFQRSIEKGNSKAMYKYGLYLLDQKQNESEGIQYIKNSADNGYSKAQYYYYNKMKEKENSKEESFKYLKESALKGHKEAMYQYGMKMTELEEDFEEGLLFLKKASDKGHIDAMFQYGQLLSNNNNNNNKIQEAARYIKIAANLGHTEAIVKYGLLLLFGNGVDVDKEEAMKCFQIAADRGNIDGLNFYSAQLMNLGNKSPEDIQKSLKYFKMAADQGHPLAMSNYAQMLELGIGIQQNKEEAVKYYKMAIEKNCATAMCLYAQLLASDDEKYQNKEEAVKFYKMAIDEDNDLAMNDYAYMLSEGDGVEKNLHEAIKLYKMAIERGNASAMINYGLMLSNGIGIPVNKVEAAKLFKMAADKNAVKGYVNYAIMLANGSGIEKNIAEGVKYFKMAIEKDDAEAMNDYGHMLLHGSGIPQNIEEAVKYFKMAIDRGNVDAMNNYGEMLSNGNGIPQDIDEALKYYKMGCDKGSSDSMLFYGTTLLTHYKKKEEALQYVKMAADLGNESALEIINVLGIQLDNQKERRKTKDVEISIECPLEKLYSGWNVNISINRNVVCKKCKGTGTKNGVFPDICENCEGHGKIYVTLQPKEDEDEDEIRQILTECFYCNGIGFHIDDDNICDECDGKQLFEKEEEITLNIPSGSKEGDCLVFEALANEFYDSDPGDLIIVIKEKKHEVFKRNENDLLICHEINLMDAYYGTQFLIDHLDERKLLIETNPNDIIEHGTVQKIEGEGMPIKDDVSKKGDLYIQYKIILPNREQLTDEFKEEILKICPIKNSIENIDLDDENVSVVTPVTISSDSSTASDETISSDSSTASDDNNSEDYSNNLLSSLLNSLLLNYLDE